jgi:cytochrome P450
MEPQKRWWKEAGVATPLIHYCQPLGTHCVIVLDADIVKDILFARYGTNPQYLKKLRVLIPLVGKGLVTLEGEDWQRHRRIIHPSFQPKFVKESLDAVVPRTVDRFITSWKKAEGREIDVGTHLSNLTLDIIGKVAFAHDFHALESVEKWSREDNGREDVHLAPVSDKLITAMSAMFKNSPKRILLAIMNLSVLDLATSRTRKLMDEAVEEVIDAARAKVQQKVLRQADGTSNNMTQDPLSLLQRLFDAKDTDPARQSRKGLNNSELRDEIKTFILAGHETTSTWCYWAVFALCKYPDVQEKLYQDIKKHTCADDSETNEGNLDISVRMIEKMTYLDAFMKEVLRLFPPAGMIVRNTVEEMTFNGAKIPARTRLLIPIHLLHRHPLYWKDPESFEPERWLQDDHPASHRYGYLPFSDGPRNCIGSYFAEMEAKLIMAPLIREFLFQLAPTLLGTHFKFTTFITMKSKPDLRVCVRCRK